MINHDEIEAIAHRTEVNVDVLEVPEGIEVAIIKGEPDMIGWFLEEMTEEYIVDAEAEDDTIVLTLRDEANQLESPCPFDS